MYQRNCRTGLVMGSKVATPQTPTPESPTVISPCPLPPAKEGEGGRDVRRRGPKGPPPLKLNFLGALISFHRWRDGQI